MQEYTAADVRKELAAAVDAQGTQTAWARLHGFQLSVVSETINAKRDASESIANALGFVRRIKFVRMEQQ